MKNYSAQADGSRFLLSELVNLQKHLSLAAGAGNVWLDMMMNIFYLMHIIDKAAAIYNFNNLIKLSFLPCGEVIYNVLAEHDVEHYIDLHVVNVSSAGRYGLSPTVCWVYSSSLRW